MLVRGNGTFEPSLRSQTATLVEATRSSVHRGKEQADSGAERVDTMRVSGLASFMSKLRSLQETDPDRSKQVLNKLAGAVRQQAVATPGTPGDKLARFADKLQAAAQTGAAVSMSPARRGPAGGGGVADKLETYSHYEGLGGGGSEEAFFGHMNEALGRILADVTSDSTLGHLPPRPDPAPLLRDGGPPLLGEGTQPLVTTGADAPTVGALRDKPLVGERQLAQPMGARGLAPLLGAQNDVAQAAMRVEAPAAEARSDAPAVGVPGQESQVGVLEQDPLMGTKEDKALMGAKEDKALVGADEDEALVGRQAEKQAPRAQQDQRMLGADANSWLVRAGLVAGSR